jgi:GNAT superfamily N-acetyltransferase
VTQGKIEIRRADSWWQRRRLVTFPWKIYADDPLWIPPLVPDRMKVTSSRRGTFFARGEAAFFTAHRNGQLVGTICAAMDGAEIESLGRRECVFGFFETVDDTEVARALFARAEAWAKERELDSLVGPFNLDYEDAYGILTDGRDRAPVILCGHTPPYYVRVMEELGFTPARPGNIALAVDLTKSDEQFRKISRAADIARKRGGFVIRPANIRDWRAEADRVHYLLNNSLENSGDGGVVWPRDAVYALVHPFLKIADPDLVLFADRTEGSAAGRTVGWFAGVPNVNEILAHVNGLRYPWNYLSLLAHMRDTPACLAAKSLLVLPEYHSSGVAALLFDEMVKRATAKGYSWIDLSLTSEANPETPVLAERSGGVRYKRYQVYRRPISR